MSDPPSGTVTFLFADIEDSTRLLHQLGDRYLKVIEDYHRLARGIFQAAGGYEEDPAGEGLFVVFPQAIDALNAALEAQQAVDAASWPAGVALRVRMGLHTGQPIVAGGGYIGLEVHRAARIASVGWGGQVLLSQTTADAVATHLPAGAGVRDLGEHRLKDLLRREQIYQLLHPDLTADFPALRSLDTLPHNLPHQLTSFVGREREMGEVKELLATTRLVTIVGPGGIGKTRLALQVAADMVEGFPHGVWLAELAGLPDAARVPITVAAAAGVRINGEKESALPRLLEHFQRKKLLLILDNCEYHVVGCPEFIATLLHHCPTLKILATSWQPLGLAAEAVFRLSPLTLPTPESTAVDEVVQAESMRLFLERAMAAQPSFTLTNSNASVVAQLCRELEGNPLAIELAAARARVLSPEQIVARLADRFKLLAGGSRTAPPRQQSLRATMDWGYGLLSEPERILLRRLSVFGDAFTLEAATAVCAEVDGTKIDVAELLASLENKSFVVTQGDGLRSYLPRAVGQYGWEKLQQSGEAPTLRHRYEMWSLNVVSHA
jgi:predicted ATPase/class 3 adenylate cyclase